MPNTSQRNSDESAQLLPDIPGYRVDSVLGRGAMSTVYRAHQIEMDRPVAIKVLSPEVAARNELVEELLQEARIAASLNHPNIVRALDAGFAHGRCYFVMELVEGETLKERIAREGALPEVEVRNLAVSLARALNELDRRRLLHRDIKPANILIDQHGVVRLVDFGLACIDLNSGDDEDARCVGTPQYMSPEQITDPASIDIRSDLFSVGVTLYHALAGECPFEAEGAGNSLSRVLYDEPEPLRSINETVSRRFARTIESLLSKDRGGRCPSPASLLAHLEGDTPVASAPSRQRAWGIAGILLFAFSIVWFVWEGNDDAVIEDRGEQKTQPLVSERLATNDRHEALSDAALMERLLASSSALTSRELSAVQNRIAAFIGERRDAVSRAIAVRSFAEAKLLAGEGLSMLFEERFGVSLDRLPKALADVVAVHRSELDLQRRQGLQADQSGLLNVLLAECDARAAALVAGDRWMGQEGVSHELGDVQATCPDEWELLQPTGRRAYREHSNDQVNRVLKAWNAEASLELSRLERLLESRVFRDAESGIATLMRRGISVLPGSWELELNRLSSEIAVARQGLSHSITAALGAIGLPRPDGSRRFEGRPLKGIALVLAPTVVLLPKDVTQLGTSAPEALLLRRLHQLVSQAQLGSQEAQTAMELRLRKALLHHIDGEFEDVLDLVAADEPDLLLSYIRHESEKAHAIIHHVSSIEEQTAHDHLSQAMKMMEEGRWSEAADLLRSIDDQPALKGGEWLGVFGATVVSLKEQVDARRSLEKVLGQRRAKVSIVDLASRRIRVTYETPEQIAADFDMPSGVFQPAKQRLRRVRRSPSLTPTSIAGMETSFPWKPGTRFGLGFTYRPTQECQPAIMILRAFGLNAVLLSRLQASGKERALRLHGWERQVPRLRAFGWSASFAGPLSHVGAELLKARGSMRRAFFDEGEVYRVELLIDDERRAQTVTINGEIVRQWQYAPLRPVDDLIEILIPNRHEIGELWMEGILRER